MSGIPSIKLKLTKDDEHVSIVRCIVCQNRGKGTLTGTSNGRDKILAAAHKLQDQRILEVEGSSNNFVYHVKPCYSNYIKKADRLNAGSSDEQGDSSTHNASASDLVTSPPPILNTRSQTGSTVSSKNVCIICDCVKGSR